MKATLIIIGLNVLTYSRPHPKQKSNHRLVTTTRRQVERSLPTALVLAVNLTPGEHYYDSFDDYFCNLDTEYRPE